MQDDMLITITPDVDYRALKESPSPEEFFLLSRLKGEVSVAELVRASGLEKSKAKKMISRLIGFGLIRRKIEVHREQYREEGSVTRLSAIPDDPLLDVFSEKKRSLSNRSDAEITKPAPDDEEPAATKPVGDIPLIELAKQSEKRELTDTADHDAINRDALLKTGENSHSFIEEDSLFSVPPKESLKLSDQSIDSMFAAETSEFDEISLNISEVSEISLDLLKGESATSKVIEIADENWDDDEDDMFGGDDEPLDDNPQISSFMDQVVEDPDEEEMFASSSIAHESRVHKSAPKIRDTRSHSSQLLISGEGQVVRGFQQGKVPTLSPDIGGFPSSFDTFVSSFVLELESDTEHQKYIDFVFTYLNSVTYYQLFNVTPEVERKTLKTAYFTFSKYFHPDTFFGKNETEVAKRCSQIFKFGSKAYETLNRKKKRAAYDQALSAHMEALKHQEEQGKLKRKNAQVGLLLKVDQLENLGNFEQAMIELRRAIALDPTRDVLIRGATLHLKANAKLSDAAGYTRMILKQNREDVDALILLGRIYEQNGMFEDALKLVGRALKLHPNEPTIKIHVDRIKSQIKGKQ